MNSFYILCKIESDYSVSKFSNFELKVINILGNESLGKFKILTLHGNVHGGRLAGTDGIIGPADVLPRLVPRHADQLQPVPPAHYLARAGAVPDHTGGGHGFRGAGQLHRVALHVYRHRRGD